MQGNPPRAAGPHRAGYLAAEARKPRALARSFRSPNRLPPTEDELRQQAVEQLKVELAMRNATASVPQMSPASVPPMSR